MARLRALGDPKVRAELLTIERDGLRYAERLGDEPTVAIQRESIRKLVAGEPIETSGYLVDRPDLVGSVLLESDGSVVPLSPS
jgi:hypothetical protein